MLRLAMFESAELGHATSKEDYKEYEEAFRVGLLTVQYDLREAASFPVILVIGGADRAGCHEVLNLLHEWMDPRYLEANVFESPTSEELERPRFWRYWRTLPAAGRIGLYYREWTFHAIADRLLGHIDEAELGARLRHIETFEKALTDDGALLLKFWLHIPKSEAKKRLRGKGVTSRVAFKATKQDRLMVERFDDVNQIAERVLRQTSTGDALWNVIEGTDFRYRNVTIAQGIIRSLTKRLAEPPKKNLAPPVSRENTITVLDQIDVSKTINKPDYETRLQKGWRRLAKLSHKVHRKGISSVFVFEGWDAAGKGGVIRRLTAAMDAGHYRVIPIGTPTDEELAHHYLWRFWRNLPRAGHAAIFDRSWYGRVLVERLEGFAAENEWKRAYAEINDFEEQIVQQGSVVLKFWLHIDAEEQLRRFKAREKVPFKKYKITPDDYRNRNRWNDYEIAADEMVQRTSTEFARWHLVAANDKRWARVQVLETVCDAFEKRLES